MKNKKEKSLLRKWGEYILNLKMRIKEKKNGTWALYLFLRATVIVFAVRAVFIGNFEYLALCILVLLLFLVPSFIEKKLDIEFPSALEKIVLLFAFAAEILGEIGEFYLIFPWWDTMLHTVNGFLCAAIGFALVDILNEKKQIQFELSPVFCVIVSLCFSMTVGVVWEFFEFGMDYFFRLDMQKDTVLNTISSVMLHAEGKNIPVVVNGITEMSINGQVLPVAGYLDIGLYDTMEDLLVNFIGAVVFSIFGYMYLASRGKDNFAMQFVPQSNDEEEGNQSDE